MKINLIKYFYKIAKENDTLSIYKLPFDKKSLTPVLSPESLDVHFGKLAKGYAERYNDGIGDKEFNEAGVYLHNIFFSQLKESKNSNKPTGQSLDLIEKKYKTYENFKDEFRNVAMTIQGSGWIYLSKSGDIKIIKNHQIKKDIAMIIDWWEHAWMIDYGHDKELYLKNMWKVINWDIVNNKLS